MELKKTCVSARAAAAALAHLFRRTFALTAQYANISGLEAVADPNDLRHGNVSALTTYCREFSTVDRHSGQAVRSFYGHPYDARREAWYWQVKQTVQTRVSSVYIDVKLNEPAMAVCAPLVNTTHSRANQARKGRDVHGLAGVACCGESERVISSARSSSTFPRLLFHD